MRTTLLFGLLCVCFSTNAATKLFVFDCGSISLADVSPFGLTNAETDAREMFVPCYMIEHAGKRMLWDGGLPLAMVGSPEPVEISGMQMRYEVSLLEQLAQINLTPADFDYVAYSHFHFDHIGAANAFAEIPLLIQAPEAEAAFIKHDKFDVFDLQQYAKVVDSPRITLNGDYDVFGDGTVTLVSTPGHTPGHQVLMVKLANTGTVLLSGDLYHFSETRSLRRVPIFNTDPEATLASMDKVERLLVSENAQLWIEHVKAEADLLQKAPAYYD
ncbi:MAG: N-acyl homoserine lactonase family protein [Pseudomonadota bacterium]